MDLSKVKLSSVTLPLALRDGIPLCPHCGDPMVEVQPGAWQCAEYARMERLISERLADAMDREREKLISDSAEPLPDLETPERNSHQ